MNAIDLFWERWMGALASASVQAGLLVIGVAAASLFLRRSRPMVRYVLWSVVLLRLCLPFGFTSPVGMAEISHWTQCSISSGDPVPQDAGAPRRFDRPAGEPMAPDGVEGVTSRADSSWWKAPGAVWRRFAMIWLAGAVILSVLVLQRWRRLQGIVGGCEPCHRRDLIALLDEWRARLGMKRAVGLKVLPPGAGAMGPCAAGFRRPCILLPARLAETWDLAALEPILIHELAHIRRGDVLVNAIQALVQVIYWFHPLVWMANAWLRKERELICDDIAVLHSGATSRRYGATILRAIEEVRMDSRWALAGVGIGESGLSQRLRRLLDGRYVVPRPVSYATIGATLFAGVAGVLVASEAPRKGELAVAPVSAPKAVAGSAADALAQSSAGEKRAGNSTAVPRNEPGRMITKEWRIPTDLLPPVPTAGEVDPLPFAVERGFTGDFSMARNWLIERGIVFQGEAAAFYTSSGYLYVRNTPAQVDLTDAIVEKLLKTQAKPEVSEPAMTRGPMIPRLDLRQATPAEAFKAITAATGVKVFYTPTAAESEGVRITLSQVNMPAMQAFQYVTRLSNLKFTWEKDGVHVSPR